MRSFDNLQGMTNSGAATWDRSYKRHCFGTARSIGVARVLFCRSSAISKIPEPGNIIVILARSEVFKSDRPIGTKHLRRETKLRLGGLINMHLLLNKITTASIGLHREPHFISTRSSVLVRCLLARSCCAITEIPSVGSEGLGRGEVLGRESGGVVEAKVTVTFYGYLRRLLI